MHYYVVSQSAWWVVNAKRLFLLHYSIAIRPIFAIHPTCKTKLSPAHFMLPNLILLIVYHCISFYLWHFTHLCIYMLLCRKSIQIVHTIHVLLLNTNTLTHLIIPPPRLPAFFLGGWGYRNLPVYLSICLVNATLPKYVCLTAECAEKNFWVKLFATLCCLRLYCIPRWSQVIKQNNMCSHYASIPVHHCIASIIWQCEIMLIFKTIKSTLNVL